MVLKCRAVGTGRTGPALVVVVVIVVVLVMRRWRVTNCR